MFLSSESSASHGPPLVVIVWPSVQRRLEPGSQSGPSPLLPPLQCSQLVSGKERLI